MAYINGKKLLQVARSVGGAGSSSQLLTTTTDATESSGTYTLALTYLSDTPNVDDYVVYVDNGSLSTLYQVSAVGETNATLNKIGDIGGGGGKQLYQHNIYFSQRDNNYAWQVRAHFTIINDDDTPLNTNDLLVDYFKNYFGANHSCDEAYTIEASGTCYLGGTHYNIHGVGLGDTYLDVQRFGFATDAYEPTTFICYNQLSGYAKSIVDNVKPL